MPTNEQGRYYCTKETCPVSDSIYGYYPSLGWNAFPLAIAALCCLLQVGMGIKWKTWSYMVAVTIGCFLEAIGMCFLPLPLLQVVVGWEDQKANNFRRLRR
jgi:hypothetical protein